MSRFVDADIAQAVADKNMSAEEAGIVQWALSHTPTANAAPVLLTKWMFAGDGVIECFRCKEVFAASLLPRNFCPNCGGKADSNLFANDVSFVL